MEHLTYHNAHRLPLLASWPVTRWTNLVPIETWDVSRRLRPHLVELLHCLLVGLTLSIGCHVDQIGSILACQLGLVGAAHNLVQILLGQLKVSNSHLRKLERKKCNLRKQGELPVEKVAFNNNT